jgi:hypothetical protein
MPFNINGGVQQFGWRDTSRHPTHSRREVQSTGSTPHRIVKGWLTIVDCPSSITTPVDKCFIALMANTDQMREDGEDSVRQL